MTDTQASPSRRAITPYVLVQGVSRFIEFVCEAFEAEELLKLPRPDGSIMHAELRIGDSMIMVGEAEPQLGPVPGSLYLTVADCDAVYQQALTAGATSVMEVTTMPHAGERYGGVLDPCGCLWWIASQLEELSAEEQKERIRKGDVPTVKMNR